MNGRAVRTIENFITAIREDAADWDTEEPVWFRGEPDSDQPLKPSLYRNPNGAARENQLLQTFRARACGFHHAVPDRSNTDQWLFLAQHVGLPTRLLDWSEGALLGLHFALACAKDKQPIVWMLNPLRLNHAACGNPAVLVRELPLPWHRPSPPETLNAAAENIAGAWEQDRPGVNLPIAVYSSYIHPRLRGQRACFTIHGKQKAGLGSLVPQCVRRYEIDSACRHLLMKELRILGITESVVFPELAGLAAELRERFP